jgi:hypothetical protein
MHAIGHNLPASRIDWLGKIGPFQGMFVPAPGPPALRRMNIQEIIEATVMFCSRGADAS